MTTLIAGFVALTTLPVPASASFAWQPMNGDRLVVDTQENMGYLIHPSGEFLAFPVATGQRRVVRYIGRVYNASTPSRSWSVESTDVKGDHMTFGPTGLFLRLYYKDERTPYGIHGHGQSEEMLSSDQRYRSMGCVIVSEDMLQVIRQTYELNGGYLSVVTTADPTVLGPLRLLAAAN